MTPWASEIFLGLFISASSKVSRLTCRLSNALSRGLEADQKVLAAYGCYAMTATTALTAQNTTGVKAVHVIPSEFVGKQIEACIEDVGVDVIKTGSCGSVSS